MSNDTTPFLIACEANTPEWYQARAGLTTASTFATAVARMQKDSPSKDAQGNPVRRKGDFTGESDKLAGNTAFELISEAPFPPPEYQFTGGAAKRGKDEEWQARAAYTQRYDVEVLESGIMVTYDRQFGYSTDGAVEGQRGGIEIKTPQDANKIIEMLRNHDSSEYEYQIQGGMWICGWEWIDLVMWMPQLRKASNELYVKRIHRDDNFIAQMERDLLEHRKRVLQLVEFFKIPHAQRPGVIMPDYSITDVTPKDVVKPADKVIVQEAPAEPPVAGLANLF